ncbi:MAG: HAMP domain-containing sensor histidine kinase [Pseudomonadota bacterium]
MTLRNKILLTIGALILITSLTIMYVASRTLYYTNVSHAYSILSMNNDNLAVDIKNRITQLRNYALSATYNKLNNLNAPSALTDNRVRYANNITTRNSKNKIIFNYPEGRKNPCNAELSKASNDDVILDRNLISENTICLYTPITISGKKYVAAFNMSLNIFNRKIASIPSLLIVPDKFELNVNNYSIANYPNAMFKKILINDELIREKISFLRTDKYFVMFQDIPKTNIKIFSYSEQAAINLLYKQFIKSSVQWMLLILVVSITIFFFAVNSFLKPIKKLCVASKCFADGEYDQEIKPTTFREINELINSFNTMVKKIKQREAELHSLNTTLEKEVDKKTNELVHAAKMVSLGTLSSGIAHEFNNILGAVIGHVSLALEKKDPKEMVEALDIALSASERACNIVARLQDFAKKKSTDHKLFNVNDAVNNIVNLVSKDFINNNIEIKTKLGVATGIIGDQSQIEQVILNLLINSKQAIPNGGKVYVTTTSGNGVFALTVTDTGTGIDDSIKNRIFEPFFTTKGVVGMGKDFGAQDTQGTGLGLSVSHGIIENHGGTIRLVSSSKSGTTFEVKLPLANT